MRILVKTSLKEDYKKTRRVTKLEVSIQDS